jgi:sulfur carrier protein ThiS
MSLTALPVAAVPASQSTIVWPRNPFHPADKDLYPVQPGSTVADWMRSQAITAFPLHTVCLVNGQPLLRRDWAIRPLAAYDVVVLVGLPGGGGGGGGSNPLRVVLSIAVVVHFWDTPHRGLAGWLVSAVWLVLWVLALVGLLRAARRAGNGFALTRQELAQDWRDIKEQL